MALIGGIMITDEQAEKALDWIRDNSEKYAIAKAQTRHLDHYRKIKRAEEFLRATGTVAERDAIAETSPDYKLAVDALRESEEQETRLKWLLTAAQHKLEVYRTISANHRRATS
jgi:hypothetical protein